MTITLPQKILFGAIIALAVVAAFFFGAAQARLASSANSGVSLASAYYLCF